MRSRIIATTLLVVFAGSACGPTFDADLMVSLEARWLCDVQRSVYDEVTDIDAALNDRLVGNGVSAETYSDFKSALIDDLALRERVLAEYTVYCDG